MSLPVSLAQRAMDTTRQFLAFLDRVIMQPHSESYRGWQIRVEVAGDSFVGEGNQCVSRYIPNIVAIEPLSIGFRELKVPVDAVYATPQHCIQGGIAVARDFIDARK